MAVLSPLPPQQRCAEVLTANPKMLCLPADPSHGEQSGTEEVIDGSGYLHEDGRLPLHCHLLRGTFPRGMDPSDRPRCSWETGTFPRLWIPLPRLPPSQGLNLHLDMETWYNMDLLNRSLRICHVQLLLGEQGEMRSHARRSQGQPSPSAGDVRGPCAETLGLGSGLEWWGQLAHSLIH